MQKLAAVFKNKPFVATIWFGLGLFPVLKSVIEGFIKHENHIHNNYFVYKYTFIHLIEKVSLYTYDAAHYQDMNHYGPVFGFVIAPFALLPDFAGVLLWQLLNTLILFIAIQKLPIKKEHALIVTLLCAHELMTSASSVQINPLVTALILFSYIFIRNEKDFWAALMIMLGVYIKLYGIVGLAFFFFSNNKLKLIGSLIFWAVVLFVLPMAISSPSFIIQTYQDWYTNLVHKNAGNETSLMQDISVMGMLRRTMFPHLSNLIVLLPAMVLFGLSYLRFSAFKNVNFQLLILASTLIFPIIFSTGSESPTYIIAFVGVALWYVNGERPVTYLDLSLMTFAFILTSLSPSDLFPRYVRVHYVEPYALKALPCFVVWLKIIYETLYRKFDKNDLSLPLQKGAETV